MTDTTHEAPEKMKTIRLTVDLTYDQEVMHGDDDEAIAWFNSILAGKDLMLGDFGELGDMIGSVQVVSRSDDLVQAAVAAALREAAERMDNNVSYNAGNRVRALITPDAQAALDRVVGDLQAEIDFLHAQLEAWHEMAPPPEKGLLRKRLEERRAAIRKGGE